MPSGCVLTREDWAYVASLCVARDLFLLYDAAMEALLFDGREPVSPLDHPGMEERTVIVGSMSKAYRMIGWRVGWVAGPAAHGQRRRLGAHLQHDRQRLRRAARGRGRAARAAGARGAAVGGARAPPRRDPRRAARLADRAPGGRLVAADRRRRDGLDARGGVGGDARGGRGRDGHGAAGAATSRRATCASCSPRSRSSGSTTLGERLAGIDPSSLSGMFPAEHRALRELHATTRQLAGHWAKLGDRLGGEPARCSTRARPPRACCSTSSRSASASCTAGPRPSPSVPRLAGARGVSDLLLERNQAFRSALLDLQHVTTLLALRGRARAHAWRRRAGRVAGRLGGAAASARGPRAGRRRRARQRPRGRDRTRRRELAGARGRQVGVAFGTIGEAIDNSPLGRLARRRAT